MKQPSAPWAVTRREVCGITLRGNDEVIGLETPRPGATLLTVCENGYGKRSAIEDYRLTNRGGVGRDQYQDDRAERLGRSCERSH
ncbi:MAG: hypothetical protein KatS3mg130_2160 [Candidatus Sumerlaea sp.]|nr:MAG: hypothetical protein KatS3mg130_2160 [Candidatus Sumerlaea sp.]